MPLSFILAIIISAGISFLLTPLIRNFFISKNWIENPKEKDKKTHNATALSSVPRGGGIPIFVAVLITAIIFLPLDKHLIGILTASFITLIIGLFDDVKDISPKIRLLFNILVALIIVASGIGIAFVSNPLNGGVIDLSFLKINFSFFGQHSIWVISDILAVIWIIWCMNIVGWATGVEGQLPGFVSISAFFIGLLAIGYSTDIAQWPVIILAGAVCGSYLGFLPFNFFPQSIMPGYSGKSLGGFLLAVLAILSGAKLATLVFLLSIPMLDAVYTIIRRLANKKPIYLGDGKHFHHQLLKAGWSRPSVAIFYWAISLTLGILSLFLNSQQKLYFFIALSFLIFGLFINFSKHK
ncbi:MAG: MraY family glycosyltransferase [Candidatus Shapirobacteria bacterium]|jgi:UDP-GlcNAc:undecaprenyl-phosphate GlcNAc-1-phosphate transferase|nr:MraY family glycosyltransferase [Candidatus Shapirobacteria bacterium]